LDHQRFGLINQRFTMQEYYGNVHDFTATSQVQLTENA